MRTRIIFWKQNKDYFHTACFDTRCMKNACHFYIRNTRSGLNKSPEERTHNETEVLHYVFTGIQKANGEREKACRNLLAEASKSYGMRAYVTIRKAMKKMVAMAYPTRDNWFLNYNTLDAIFKHTKHPVYTRMSSQVNQNAIRKAVAEWTAYFKALATWLTDPKKFRAKPKQPGYSKDEENTAWFSNQTAKLVTADSKQFLSFVNSSVVIPVGKLTGKYIKTEIQPWHGAYRILVTTEDEIKEIEAPKKPDRIMGIDLGVDNLAAVSNNYGATPFLIRGFTVKAANQWYNKRRSKLMSDLTRGTDSTHSTKTSKALNALSRQRNNVMRDFFYKAAWCIVRKAKWDRVDVIVIGHNRGQKDSISLGHKTNQSFVSIPFTKFISIIKETANRNGIAVAEREESYTSKASVLDMDDIPAYRANDTCKYEFSGKRKHRGLYMSKDGILINADINGASNILRKEYPDAFSKMTNLSYLYRTTAVIGHKELYAMQGKYLTPEQVRLAKARAKKPGITSRIKTREHWDRKIDYMRFFDAGKKIWKPAA